MADSPLDSPLVTALLTARDDPATSEFDRVLATAEASGRLDETTARELRYWQRRSLDGLVEHAAAIIPATLIARRQADAAARDATAQARLSWEQARAMAHPPLPPHTPPSDPEPGAPSRRTGAAGLTVVADDD